MNLGFVDEGGMSDQINITYLNTESSNLTKMSWNIPLSCIHTSRYKRFKDALRICSFVSFVSEVETSSTLSFVAVAAFVAVTNKRQMYLCVSSCRWLPLRQEKNGSLYLRS